MGRDLNVGRQSFRNELLTQVEPSVIGLGKEKAMPPLDFYLLSLKTPKFQNSSIFSS